MRIGLSKIKVLYLIRGIEANIRQKKPWTPIMALSLNPVMVNLLYKNGFVIASHLSALIKTEMK